LNLPNGLPAVNSNTVSTAVNAAPSTPTLTLTNAVDPSSASPGDILLYTLRYANTGSTMVVGATVQDQVPAGTTYISSDSSGEFAGGVVRWPLPNIAPGGTGQVRFRVQINSDVPQGSTITNQGQLNPPGGGAPILSNTVATTVGPATPVASVVGTWTTFPRTGSPPATAHASLTVDPNGRFTVWARSQDGSTIAHWAQGAISAAGTLDVTSTDNAVHFTGQLSADRQTAQITAARSNADSFTVTAARQPDVNAVPTQYANTFNGNGLSANGDQLAVALSIDPGGNATVAARAVNGFGVAVRQFSTLAVTPDGKLVSTDGQRQVGTLQTQNSDLVLSYDFQTVGYENLFSVPLQPFAASP